MGERWHKTAALVGLPGIPRRARTVRLHADRKRWVKRTVMWGKQPTFEWLESSLPAETQTALRQTRGEDTTDITPVPESATKRCAPDLSGLIPDTTSADLMDARAYVVGAFNVWLDERGGPVVPALHNFVAAWAAGDIAAPASVFELVPKMAWNTLHRWRNIYRSQGIRGLHAAKGGGKPIIDRDPEIASLVAAMIFERPDHVTARHIHRALGVRFPGKKRPSIASIQRYAARFKVEHAAALSAATDRDGHRSRAMPAFGDRAAQIESLNQTWEFDSTPADILCSDGKRYAVVGGIDIWSRRGKLLLAPTSCGAAISSLLRRCLLSWGVPGTVRTDEGADYTSQYIVRVLGELGINHDILPPYSPEKKPFIERFLGTVSRDLFSQLPGFTGHNVSDREKLRSRLSFADRRGKQAQVLFEVSLSAEELQERLDSWCDNLYGREAHAGLDGQSPFLRAASWSEPIRTVDERQLDILLAAPAGGGTATVQKKGIRVERGTYIAPELGEHMRKRVQVRRDPGDWGRIYVFEITGRFICVAEDPNRTGIDRAEVAARAKARAARQDAAARKLARTFKSNENVSGIMDEILQDAAARAGNVMAFPAPMKPHESAGLDAADAAQKPTAAEAQSSRKRNQKFVNYYKQAGKI